MQKETRKIKANLTEDIVNGPMFVNFFTITLLDELASAPMAISMSASNGEMCRLNLALISMFSGRGENIIRLNRCFNFDIPYIIASIYNMLNLNNLIKKPQ